MTNDQLGELLREIRDDVRGVRDDLHAFKTEMYAFKSEMYSFRDEMYAFKAFVEDRLTLIDARFDHLEATIALGFEGQAIMREAFDRRFDAADQAHREQFGLLQAVARQTTGRLRQLEGH